MGQGIGRHCEAERGDYIEEQLRIYRWRADPSTNSHLARVAFNSKDRLIGRNKLHSFLHQQLQSQNYVDLQKIHSLVGEKEWRQGEQVMTFEDYAATLATLEGRLTIEQVLYAFQALLCGFESIYHRMRKVHVSANCCFLTENGQLRAWVNPDPTLNEFPENCNLQTGESTAINQILRVCSSLALQRSSFFAFHRQLCQYLDRDLLHNTGFSAVRRFVNGYLYSHKILLPQNISGHLRPTKAKHSSLHNTPFNRSPSLSELVQPDWQSNDRAISTGLNDRLVSTGSSREIPENTTESEDRCSSSNSSNGQSRQIEFYRPNQEHEKKLSNLGLNTPKCTKRSLNRPEVVKKKSVELSVSSSFSKKQEPQYCKAELYELSSPKNACRTRTGFQSTSAESFLHHSRDPSGFTGSKIAHSSSSNFFENCHKLQSRPNFYKKQKENMEYYEGDRNGENRARFVSQQQSRHPSFDEGSSSLFVSPASERMHLQTSQAYKQPDLSKIEAVPDSEQSESASVPPSFSNQNINTRHRLSPSQMLHRQVSGLVENEDICTFESQGSFLSFQHSISSEYQGTLMGMCHSTKILHSTRKQIQRRQSKFQNHN